MRKSVFLSFVAFVFCIHAFSQETRQYSFTHFSTTNGLTSNIVRGVSQDSRGFIWVGTLNGLHRYDGNKFMIFRAVKYDKTSLPTDNIEAVFVDSYDRLWLSFLNDFVGYLDTRTLKYTAVKVNWKSGDQANSGKRYLQLPNGEVLMNNVQRGVYKYDSIKKEFSPADELLPYPKGWKRLGINYDKYTGRYLMSCDSGFAVFNPKKNLLSYRGHNVENDPFIETVKDIKWGFLNFHHARFGYIVAEWAPNAAGPGVYNYNEKTGQLTRIHLPLNIGYHEIWGVLLQQSERLWIHGRPFIAEYKGDGKFEVVRNEYRTEQSLKFDVALSMFEDKHNNIWISTSNGLFLFNPETQYFNSYTLVRPDGTGAVEGPVQTALNRTNGDIWIGCWGLGLYTYDRDFKPIPVPPSLEKYKTYLSIWSMKENPATGQIWIGMQGGSLMVYDQQTGKSETFAPEIFREKTVRQLTIDWQGNVWFGTQGGDIIKWDRELSKGDVTTGFRLVRKKSLIHKLITDSQGYIWAAEAGYAFVKIDPVTEKVIDSITKTGPPDYRYQGNSPTDIIQYNDSVFILATGSLELLNVRSRKTKMVESPGSSPLDNVLSLEKDNDGILWLAMSNGLCRMNVEKQLLTFYDRRDGMPKDNFDVASAYRLNDGRMLFAHDNTFIAFDPSKIITSGTPPDVQITDLRISNKSVLVDSVFALGKMNLEYDRNSLEVEFASLEYGKQNKLIYYYMLDGLDKDWIQADRKQAIYSYLPPGKYELRVRAINGDGIPTKNITTLAIHVQPPFYKAWWFYGFLALMGIGLLYWIDRERMRRLLALQQVRSQIAGNLHTDVTTTLSNINLLSELAKIKADKDISKSKEFIDQIHEKSRRMIDAMDDMMWSIQPENDNMQKTLARMTEFAQGLQKNHDFEIEMIVDNKVRSIELDMKTRHEIFLIFKEALKNVTVHSAASMVFVNIDLVRSTLMLNIHDDGRGFDMQSVFSGNGIDEMKKRAVAIKADLDIQSDKKGTSIILKIPI